MLLLATQLYKLSSSQIAPIIGTIYTTSILNFRKLNFNSSPSPIKLVDKSYYSNIHLTGARSDNLINRQFKALKSYEKCYTDVTEFSLQERELYLSPVLDGFNSEIINLTLSLSPDLKQVQIMLEKTFPADYYERTILHSDQGWQYQHQSYHQFLESKGIRQLMSRKGNSPDNGMMESFFGILKSEMFYGFEQSYQSLEELEQAITNYIFGSIRL